MARTSSAVLFIFGGLPATGKTSVARVLARISGACHLRIDTIEQALVRNGLVSMAAMSDKGYRIACELAKDQLNNGVSVIADCVNPIELSRRMWREAALASSCPFVEVEFICSDPAIHRARAELRKNDIDGHVVPSWEQIAGREYEPWRSAGCVVDTARLEVAGAAGQILEAAARLFPGDRLP